MKKNIQQVILFSALSFCAVSSVFSQDEIPQPAPPNNAACPVLVFQCVQVSPNPSIVPTAVGPIYVTQSKIIDSQANVFCTISGPGPDQICNSTYPIQCGNITNNTLSSSASNGNIFSPNNPVTCVAQPTN